MRLQSRPGTFPFLLACVMLAGCSQREAYYAPAPPPAPASYAQDVPPLVRLADGNGFRSGYDDGKRDAYYHRDGDPRRNAAYRDALGYDYRLGPIQPYVDAFRRAYLRGYDRSFQER